MTITKPTTKQMRYDQLTVDSEVQRILNEAQARHIADDFKPEAVGTLVVSHRTDGTFHVMDGQTRRAGALYAGRGEDLVDCQVYEGLNRSEEAAMFRLLNDRRSVGPIDKYLVRVVEQESVALQINALLQRHGWRVSHARNQGKVQAVGALETVFTQAAKNRDEAYARSVLGTTIVTITDAWGHDPDGMRAEILQGVGAVYTEHASVVDRPKLMREMAQYDGGPLALVGRAKGLREMRGGKVADNMADVLVNLHNKQKRAGKLPTWRSE